METVVVPTELLEPAVLDREALACVRDAQIDGEPDLLAACIDLYLVEGPARVRTIADAAAAGDAALLMRTAHSLKSDSHTLGASEAGRIAAALERMGRENAFEGADDRIRQLSAAVASACLALRDERGAGA